MNRPTALPTGTQLTLLQLLPVGILVAVAELPWELVSIGVALVPVSRIWRGPVAAALGGLQYKYQ